jgi:hypothetical protein
MIQFGDIVTVSFPAIVTQVKDGWIRVLHGTEVHWVRESEVSLEDERPRQPSRNPSDS